ncbi:MAG: hypothetical protein JAZ17_06070 [Candidatus Thiodiazotropha endolucinida]|nr:hypothetical protein [Candidatus Thiodiazotropha endolucinida]
MLITIAGLLLAGLSLSISRQTTRAEFLCKSLDAQRSEKVRALDSMYDELGFGGMIHRLKDIVLNHHKEDRIAGLIHLGAAKAPTCKLHSTPLHKIPTGTPDSSDHLFSPYNVKHELTLIILPHPRPAGELLLVFARERGYIR